MVLRLCDEDRGQESRITSSVTCIPPSCHQCQTLSYVCALPMPSIIPAHSRYTGAFFLVEDIGLHIPFPSLSQVNAESHLPMCSRILSGNLVCKLESS